MEQQKLTLSRRPVGGVKTMRRSTNAQLEFSADRATDRCFDVSTTDARRAQTSGARKRRSLRVLSRGTTSTPDYFSSGLEANDIACYSRQGAPGNVPRLAPAIPACGAGPRTKSAIGGPCPEDKPATQSAVTLQLVLTVGHAHARIYGERRKGAATLSSGEAPK
jgi:hypothetical protein